MVVERFKNNVIKGVRASLVSFLICFGVAFVVSIIINIGFLEKLNVLLNGSLSEIPKGSFSNVLIITSLIINFSVFNSGTVVGNGGNLHIGMLIFITLPAIAFFVADRRNNREKHFNSQDLSVYVISSLLFGFYVYGYSLITEGELLGIKINFSNPMNFLMTIVIVLTLQFFIGFNYNKSMPLGIRTSRWLLRCFLILGVVVSIVGMIFVFNRYTQNVFLLVGALILLVPNMAIYSMFMFMGASIEFGDQLQTLMSKFGIDLSFATLELPIRIGFIGCFFVIITIAIWRLGREKFLEELFLFATSFSVISLIFAYCTTMNLGFVKNLIDVQFGINYMFAFMVPFVVILLAGLLLHIFRLIISEIRS